MGNGRTPSPMSKIELKPKIIIFEIFIDEVLSNNYYLDYTLLDHYFENGFLPMPRVRALGLAFKP